MPSLEYQCFGFLYGNYPTIIPEEYWDFRYKVWPMIELSSDLRGGVLPTGMLLRAKSGEIVVVKGKKLVPFAEFVGEN